ncbi:hypothetical protein KW790_02140 [Candidatus Parcubacteria bacterium]|nr:hypothetical protein [Candidatus Parcubacteria bacterium]
MRIDYTRFPNVEPKGTFVDQREIIKIFADILEYEPSVPNGFKAYIMLAEDKNSQRTGVLLLPNQCKKQDEAREFEVQMTPAHMVEKLVQWESERWIRFDPSVNKGHIKAWEIWSVEIPIPESAIVSRGAIVWTAWMRDRRHTPREGDLSPSS